MGMGNDVNFMEKKVPRQAGQADVFLAVWNFHDILGM